MLPIGLDEGVDQCVPFIASTATASDPEPVTITTGSSRPPELTEAAQAVGVGQSVVEDDAVDVPVVTRLPKCSVERARVSGSSSTTRIAMDPHIASRLPLGDANLGRSTSRLTSRVAFGQRAGRALTEKRPSARLAGLTRSPGTAISRLEIGCASAPQAVSDLEVAYGSARVGRFRCWIGLRQCARKRFQVLECPAGAGAHVVSGLEVGLRQRAVRRPKSWRGLRGRAASRFRSRRWPAAPSPSRCRS